MSKKDLYIPSIIVEDLHEHEAEEISDTASSRDSIESVGSNLSANFYNNYQKR